MNQLTELMFNLAKEADQLRKDKNQTDKAQVKHKMAEILGTELLQQHHLSNLSAENL